MLTIIGYYIHIIKTIILHIVRIPITIVIYCSLPHNAQTCTHGFLPQDSHCFMLSCLFFVSFQKEINNKNMTRA